VLHGRPIGFRSSAVRLIDGGTRLAVEGELTIAGATRPIAAALAVDGDGDVSGTFPIAQSDWGIKPYRGMLGALKVRDEVEIAIAARLPVH
jgi:polyisoprenoid-binding protein YceI